MLEKIEEETEKKMLAGMQVLQDEVYNTEIKYLTFEQCMYAFQLLLIPNTSSS